MAGKIIRADFAALAKDGRIAEGEACKIIGKSRTTLRRWRMNGTGPKHRVEHKRLISYVRADVEAFANELKAAA